MKKPVKEMTLYVAAIGAVGGVFATKTEAEDVCSQWNLNDDGPEDEMQVVEAVVGVNLTRAPEHFEVAFDPKGRLRGSNLVDGPCAKSEVMRLTEGDYLVALDLDPNDYSMVEAIEEAQRLFRLHGRSARRR